MGGARWLESAEVGAVCARMRHPVIVTGPDWRILHWTPGAEALFGWSEKEVVGEPLARVLPESEAAALEERARKMAHGELACRSWENRRKDGGEVFVEVRAFALGDEDGLWGYALLAEDASDRREAARQLRASEMRYRLATRATDEAIWDWDARTGAVSRAPGFERVFGWETPGGDGQWWRSRIHPGDRERVLATLDRTIEDREGQFSAEYRFRRKDGSYADVHDRAYLVWEDGELRRMVGAIADVTDRVTTKHVRDFLGEAAAILGESLEYEQQLGRLARQAVRVLAEIAFLDLAVGGGRFRRAAIELADPDPGFPDQPIEYDVERRDYPPARAAGSGEIVLLPEIHLGAYVDILRDMVSPEYAEAVERARPSSIACLPFSGEAGVAGVLVLHHSEASGRRFREADRPWFEEISRRITAAVRVAEAARERNRALEEADTANRAKDEFLALLGHELRNPLAPMRTALELIEMRVGDEFSQERAVLDRQMEHLSRLVDDLLDISRITRGQVELRKRRVDLREIVGDAVKMVDPLLEERRHRLHVDVVPLWVDGDPARLTQVVANLLSNAAKFTPRKGRIEIRGSSEDGETVLRVRDNGIGIDEDLMPRLFELFVQGKKAHARKEGGLGLGLAIAKRLTEMHGGTVRAKSEGRGKGSEFVVRLPEAAAPEDAETVGKEEEEEGGERAPAARPGRRILVVDDNRDAADVLADALALKEFEVEVAYDAPSALDKAREFEPDVVLLDLGLPVMDGYEVAERLREQPENEDTPLVAVTGYGQAEDKKRTREAGFEAHVVKPVGLGEIVRIIEAALDEGAA